MHVVRTARVPLCLTWALVTLCLIPSGWAAETAHVISSSELQIEAAKASQSRQENIAKVRNFLSTPAAADVLKKAHVDPQQAGRAVAELSDEEVAQLAARADQAQKDFAAGVLSTRDIALVILGVALIILIIVIVR